MVSQTNQENTLSVKEHDNRMNNIDDFSTWCASIKCDKIKRKHMHSLRAGENYMNAVSNSRMTKFNSPVLLHGRRGRRLQRLIRLRLPLILGTHSQNFFQSLLLQHLHNLFPFTVHLSLRRIKTKVNFYLIYLAPDLKCNMRLTKHGRKQHDIAVAHVPDAS